MSIEIGSACSKHASEERYVYRVMVRKLEGKIIFKVL
jgi:hypothetical protein